MILVTGHFQWNIKERKIDSFVITLLLIYCVSKFRELNRKKLEGKEYYQVFLVLFVSILIYKMILHIMISYQSESETLYVRMYENYINNIFSYFLSIGGSIWAGIWLGNGNIEKILQKRKTKIYSSSDKNLINKIHKLFTDYQIESTIEKNKLGSYDLVIYDNQDRIKAVQLLDSVINK